jgi:hypothetical protein
MSEIVYKSQKQKSFFSGLLFPLARFFADAYNTPSYLLHFQSGR